MPVLSFFEWCERTRIGTVVRESLWLFPVVEAVHLLALALLGGAILLVDLRMLGVGLRRQGIGELAGHVRPWLVTAVVLMIATGVPLFLSEAVKCYYNTSFWVKMGTLPFALFFAFTVRDRVTREPEIETSARTRGVALVSMTLWLVVAAAGRWIGFTG